MALMLAASVLAAGLAVLAPAARAADFSWTGAVSSDWFAPGNWSPAGVPEAVDTATVNVGTVDVPADATVDVPADATVDVLNLGGGTIQGPGTLTITATLNWNGWQYERPGTTVMPAGAVSNAVPTGVLVLADRLDRTGGDCVPDESGDRGSQRPAGRHPGDTELRVRTQSSAAQSRAVKIFELGAGEFFQLNEISRAMIGPSRDTRYGDPRNMQLDVQVMSETGSVIAFISSLDNGSGDSIFRPD